MTDGYNGATLSEVIDLSCSGYHRCPDWVDFPSDAYGATGGLLEGVPIICGGYSNYQYFDECYKVTANKVYFFVTMSTKRYGAASVIIDHPTLHYGRLWEFKLKFFEIGQIQNISIPISSLLALIDVKSLKESI